MKLQKWHGINAETNLTYCGKDSSGDQCCHVFGEDKFWDEINLKHPDDCCKACKKVIKKLEHDRRL